MCANEFERVRSEGVSVRSGPIRLAFLPGESTRLGLVVSKRVGNSPVRNRFKRVIREFFRLNRSEFPKGDCVVIVCGNGVEIENEEIREHLVRAAKKLRGGAGR